MKPFQSRVLDWMMACFSMEICRDGTERNHRFLEESLELVQSLGCTRSEAHQLVDYVFDRPAGEPNQELGGVMVTIAALCFPNELSMDEAAETELARVWKKIDIIRAKQATKPAHSPLPAAPQSLMGVQRVQRTGEALLLLDEVTGYAKANADAARTKDEQDTWRAHERNLRRVRAALPAHSGSGVREDVARTLEAALENARERLATISTGRLPNDPHYNAEKFFNWVIEYARLGFNDAEAALCGAALPKHAGQAHLPPIDETLHSPEVVASLQHRALAPHAGQAGEGPLQATDQGNLRIATEVVRQSLGDHVRASHELIGGVRQALNTRDLQWSVALSAAPASPQPPSANRFEAALRDIASMEDEDGDQDGRDKFRNARSFAQRVLDGIVPASAASPQPREGEEREQQIRHLCNLIDECAEAADRAAEDIGGGRGSLEVLREMVIASESIRSTLPPVVAEPGE